MSMTHNSSGRHQAGGILALLASGSLLLAVGTTVAQITNRPYPSINVTPEPITVEFAPIAPVRQDNDRGASAWEGASDLFNAFGRIEGRHSNRAEAWRREDVMIARSG